MYTYNIQLAGYDYSQYDEKGEIDLHSFLSFIEQFPWLEQLDRYNQIQEGCSATVSVNDQNTQNVLWVSIAGNNSEYSYLIGYVYPRRSKGFLGLGKEKIKRWVDIYKITDLTLIKELFTLFFSNKEALLQEHLSKEEKFQSMAAHDK